MDDFKKLLDNNVYNELGYIFNKKSASSHEFLKRSLENLKMEDEMVILNTLTDLCSELSMANDNLADDANCPTLIKELIILLDKYYMLPDIGITALNCLNYLLDINPRYTSIIVKWNGIPKIVKMTQNFEYFECAETVIKAIEKMSQENPYIMIENDAFSSLLNLIEFCDLSLRKTALKACVNMTNCINNQDFIKKFIMPSISHLSNLARFSGESELEKVILDLSVQCIYNIIIAIKNYNLNNNMISFYKAISENGILENLYDIFLRYLKIDKESVYDDEQLLRRKSSLSLQANSTSSGIGINANSTIGNQSSNKNAFINLETFKNIIKIFEYFCNLNSDITNGILNMNILNVLYYILVKELGLISGSNALKKAPSNINNSDNVEGNKTEIAHSNTNSDLNMKINMNGVASTQDRTKVSSNSQGYFVEIFNLLISLFPNKASKGAADRLLAPENLKFFTYFSEKILCLIINNIVNIPSSNSMVQIFKLFEMYINASPNEYIFKYIDPVKFANIANKMLDSKDSSYIMQVFSVVEIIMNKIPTHFIASLIRQGVIANIKNLIIVDDSSIYIPTDTQAFFKELENYAGTMDNSNFNNFNINNTNYPFDDLHYNEEDLFDDSDFLNPDVANLENKNISCVKVIKKTIANTPINNHNSSTHYSMNNIKREDQNSYTDIKASESQEKNKINKLIKITDEVNKEFSPFNDFYSMLNEEKNDIDQEHKIQTTAYNTKYKVSNFNTSSNDTCNLFSKDKQALLKNVSNIPQKENKESPEKIDQNSDIKNAVKNPNANIRPKKTNTVNNTLTTTTDINQTNAEPINISKKTKVSTKKTSVTNTIANLIHSKAKEISDKFFSEEKIDDLLKQANIKTNPRGIIKKLINLKDLLKNSKNNQCNKFDNNKKEEKDFILKSIAENLFCNEDENSTPTFYEIEKSEVILYFSKYLDENFKINLENTKETDTSTDCSLSHKYNFEIIKNVQEIFKAINYDLSKVNTFISNLQNCISSMNCFKLYIYDLSNLRNYTPSMFLSSVRNNSQKLRVKFNYESAQENLTCFEFSKIPYLSKILEINDSSGAYNLKDRIKAINQNFNNSYLVNDDNEINLIREIHEFYKTIKSHSIYIDLYENLYVVKDYFLKIKTNKKDESEFKDSTNPNTNNLNKKTIGTEADFYEDFLSHITNRKNSGDDEIDITEKLLQKIIERKKSIETNFIRKTQNSEEISHTTANISNNNNNLLTNSIQIPENTLSSNNNLVSGLDLKLLDDKLDFVFYAVINNEKHFIKDNINVIEFFRDLKNKIKKSDYSNYTNDVQVYFTVYLKNNNQDSTEENVLLSNKNFVQNDLLYNLNVEKINPAWNFSNINNDLDIMEKVKYFNYYKFNNQTNSNNMFPKNKKNSVNDDRIILDSTTNSITNFTITDNLENVLFEKYYYENIVNNPGLYCIKRASPFVYLISLFELATNNFKNIFPVENKNDEDFGLKTHHSNVSIDPAVLENKKVTSLLFKQIKDPYAVSNLSIPAWCKELIYNFTYLSGFSSRYLLFKITSFDVKRAISNLYLYLKNFLGENVIEDKNLSNFKRLKYKVERSSIISYANNLMKENANFSGFIEYEYNDETGTGLGPTLEFYSLCFKEITEAKNLWYNTTNNTLFPAPVFEKEEQERREKIFMLLGFLIARALFDDRLIDLPINSLFWDLVLDRPISYNKIELFDKDLDKAYKDFLKLLKKRQYLIEKNRLIDENEINDKILYNGTKVEEIGLTFNVPGYNQYELKTRGSDILVTINNLEEYLALTFDKLIFSGIDPLVKAFKKGFNKVFKIESLKCFTNKELEEIICGCEYDTWDYETLIENIIPSHGYEKNSPMFQGIIQVMLNMNSIEKKIFLQFVTGSPRLPLGGFKNLSPKLTVVMKKMINDEDPNSFLPTVMTCQKNLKIPSYSSIEILKERLFLAMYEGNNAFHLS